jgi:hypothetical protein
MPLDHQELVRQIEAISPTLKTSFSSLENNVLDALSLYNEARETEWRELVLSRQIPQSLGYPVSGLRQNQAIEQSTRVYTVVATDGSVIPPDRHAGTSLYHVINTGQVMLRYGPGSDAEINSNTRFFVGDITDEEQETLTPQVIDLKRDFYEIAASFDLAVKYKADLVLMDGPLTMWGSRDRNDQDSVSLRQGYYQILGRFKENQIPIVGYISNTHSQAVTNSLRLLLSERPQLTLLDFEGGPGPTKTKPARGKQKGKLTGIAGVQDADLYRQVLSPGHYSEVFQTAFSEPKELTTYIDQVCFLYWRTDNEIVRLEFPLWVVEKGLIPAAMSLVQDQNRRGQGYPVALMEAHESAVLRPGDRELLRILLEENGLLQPESEKGRSKRLRGI